MLLCSVSLVLSSFFKENFFFFLVGFLFLLYCSTNLWINSSNPGALSLAEVSKKNAPILSANSLPSSLVTNSISFLVSFAFNSFILSNKSNLFPSTAYIAASFPRHSSTLFNQNDNSTKVFLRVISYVKMTYYIIILR